jgi:hypothetical protein
VRCYGCVKVNGGCGSVFILAEPVEDFITEAVLRRLDGDRLGRARARLDRSRPDDDRVQAEIHDLEARLAELGRDFYVNSAISRSTFTAAHETLATRLATAHEGLASLPRAGALDGVTDIRGEWNGLSLDRKRAIIGTLLADVAIQPAKGPRNRFDAERIDFPPGCWKA